MDTSDRQVAETGRNRELGLIPAMVMAVVATLSGAGVSFAPLYERIWGGMMLHPNCPAIGRMTYYLSGQRLWSLRHLTTVVYDGDCAECCRDSLSDCCGSTGLFAPSAPFGV